MGSLDEAESAGCLRVFVQAHDDPLHGAHQREEIKDGFFGGGEREVAHIQSS